MGRLDTFVAPQPNGLIIRMMDWVNRIVMLKGVVGLRDLPPINRLACVRGIVNIRVMDFPSADQERLRRATLPGNACFVTPNHPEFFTDWMIDKELGSRFFPRGAYWATNAVVNGLGSLVQKFWLANNLIAQIPGNSGPAREYSVNYALDGNVVLLHPEGSVGWHRNVVADLMPGAVEMALEVVRRGRERGESREVWLAPIVWKLQFTGDVECELSRECAYVEKKLAVGSPANADLAERVYAIYSALLSRDEAKLGVVSTAEEPFANRHARVLETLCALIANATKSDPAAAPSTILRSARKHLRNGEKSPDEQLKRHADMLERALRIGPFAWARNTMSPEEVAEHIKRLRNDYCFGSWRDDLNRFMPQPAGPRIAHVRVPDPIAMHDFSGTVEEASAELQRRLQAALDGIDEGQPPMSWRNPFKLRVA